jgi:aromatic-L-amino-acid/L-tryptophan decarboxylase
VWCALRVFGVAAFRAAIDHILGLAQYMADRIQSEPALELMAPVTLTAVCLRVKDADDATQARVLADLTSEGTALLGPVTIRGRAGIRACIVNYRTTQGACCKMARSVH